MNKEQATIETKKNPEAQKDHESPQSIESPEEIRQQMMSESEKETAHFKKECTNDLAQAETRAEKDGLIIDSGDKEELQGLGKEADLAKEELETEITPIEHPDQRKNIESPIEKANIVGVTKDRNFEGSVIIKVEDKEGRITGYAIRKDIRGNLEGNEIKYMKNGTIGPVYQLHESDISKLREQGILESYENMPTMKERAIESPELLSEKEASKKFLAEERKKLADEIRTQRKSQRDRLSTLKINIEDATNAPENKDVQQEDRQYAQLSEMQSTEANTIAERISSSELSEKDAVAERENIGQLIDNSDGVSFLKKKLEDHYAKADKIAQKKFEAMQKTVEQTMIRNNAFIVHTFLLDEKLRHNANSNISKRATLEDDIDILLSLEPSISTSSVMPGSRHGLWNEGMGVIIGGGEIRGGVQTDNQTQTGGIKERNGTISTSEEIDKIVSDKAARGYNELVVNNPEVFGFFQNVSSIDKDGRMSGFDPRHSSKENFMQHMNLAREKGMPLMVMTPDRKLFEFVDIADNGIVSVGLEITPKQVATGKAGLSSEKRKGIGEKIISKNLFKYINHQKEAKGIITGLSDEKSAETELTREEYLKYVKDNPGLFNNFPTHLLEDKSFMLEAAQFDPASAYIFAGENLKNDVDFIKSIYSLDRSGDTRSIYSYMPTDLKKDESVALLAIENNDFEKIDSGFIDSPAVWDQIVDKLVENKNPDNYSGSSRGIGSSFYLDTDFMMGNVNVSDKLVKDEKFIQKLKNKYKNYRFEVNEYKQILVTRLA
jgi:hypothetical protein